MHHILTVILLLSYKQLSLIYASMLSLCFIAVLSVNNCLSGVESNI